MFLTSFFTFAPSLECISIELLYTGILTALFDTKFQDVHIDIGIQLEPHDPQITTSPSGALSSQDDTISRTVKMSKPTSPELCRFHRAQHITDI